jgi:hypothetical protein
MTQLVLTPGTITWTVPDDWNNANNSIRGIGCGGVGGNAVPGGRHNNAHGGGGGGSGAWAESVNVALVPGTVCAVQVPSGGGAQPTTLLDSGSAMQLSVDYGKNASGSSPGAGGLAANCICNGSASDGAGGAIGSDIEGGAGAGAAGANGAGAPGSGTTGGAADGSTVAGGSASNAGNSGTEFDSSHGCGSGAGGQPLGVNGVAGGNYGGGGGGAGADAGLVGGAGGGALIVINYGP